MRLSKQTNLFNYGHELRLDDDFLRDEVTAIAFRQMGRFITRREMERDRELLVRLVKEARRCYEDQVPKSETIALLVELAGDNPRAFRTIGGKDTRTLTRTSEGQAILKVLALAASTMNDRTRVGIPRAMGERRTPAEQDLASMPVDEAFSLLAQEEPALLEAAQDVLRERSRVAATVTNMQRSVKLSIRL